jgi:hypothetical protein
VDDRAANQTPTYVHYVGQRVRCRCLIGEDRLSRVITSDSRVFHWVVPLRCQDRLDYRKVCTRWVSKNLIDIHEALFVGFSLKDVTRLHPLRSSDSAVHYYGGEIWFDHANLKQVIFIISLFTF